MEEANESDILKTQMDLVNLSEIDTSSCPMAAQNELDPLHPSSRGFCVKEYEEAMEALRKENFNLKLRIYHIEDKNSLGIPQGAEELYKQNLDLKVWKDSVNVL